MLSTLILSEHSYPAMPLAEQPEHHWFVHFGPLVLEAALLKYPTPTTDRDQTVSRRFEPSSHPGAAEGPKGLAVRQLKRYASWVQNVVRQFGPYPSWA